VRRLAAALALLALAPAARAEDPPATQETRPLFEAGIAGGGGWLPDYPASDESHLRGLFLPYLLYRGELFRADDSGLRGRLYRERDAEINISFAGGFPVSSSDNEARAGMGDLDWLGEVGPTLRLTLWRDAEAPRRRFVLDTPLRAVFSTDLSSVRFRGFTFTPELAYEERGVLNPYGRLRVSLGPVFATGRLMDYFYQVGSEDVRPGRPAFDASGGYLGTRLAATFRQPLSQSLSVVVSARVDAFWGATNSGSPLFKSDLTYALAAGFAWSFYQSETRVPVGGEPLE
jgi:outer membrane scaffolding protein for murein synthesis (MipA/OmpV family)